MHFGLKSGIWYSNNFNDFPENQLLKFHRIGMSPPYQILDWYGGLHTCHTASGATKYSSSEYSIQYSNEYSSNKLLDSGSPALFILFKMKIVHEVHKVK